jgi:hypothetical protein
MNLLNEKFVGKQCLSLKYIITLFTRAHQLLLQNSCYRIKQSCDISFKEEILQRGNHVNILIIKVVTPRTQVSFFVTDTLRLA